MLEKKMPTDVDLFDAALDKFKADNPDSTVRELHAFEFGFDAAVSAIRAQADAQPVATVVAVDEYGPRLEWEKHWVELIGAKLYTHPEASAPGLSDDEWLALAERHANADWNSAQPDGYLNAVKALVQDATSLTRASAATVAEPSGLPSVAHNAPPMPSVKPARVEAAKHERDMEQVIQERDVAEEAGTKLAERVRAAQSGQRAPIAEGLREVKAQGDFAVELRFHSCRQAQAFLRSVSG
ncbi:hypothetical protein B0B51_23205 (plasmid) [blood disease bacterium A2-HR MARDI]|uniref:Uncharacterized protein n=3 Tax=Ralstonia syzygii TaxID=28097 RepID=A0A1U9VPT3_9RALS|nr:hypothetical protein B0B51_23205 [blood disease bacterium A2-HR MARDI]CCA83751.1 hypothetical protein BDB_mp70205 [blood disease bacterium R229]